MEQVLQLPKIDPEHAITEEAKGNKDTRQRLEKIVKLVRTGNARSFKDAAMKVGYTEKSAELVVAKNKHDGTFKALLDQYLPDEELLGKHGKVLDKVDKEGQPHSDVVRGLELAYKMKGYIKPEGTPANPPQALLDGQNLLALAAGAYAMGVLNTEAKQEEAQQATPVQGEVVENPTQEQ